tara:strand:- start:54 stop:1202 length:1149 start_codon:yes stop_codon:yes gene_type:complete
MVEQKTDFNKIIDDCTKNIKLIGKNINTYKSNKIYKNDKNYENTLNKNVGSFKLSTTELKKITAIAFNGKNNDGVFSGAIVYHFLKENNIDPKIIKTGQGNLSWISKEVKDEYVIFLDLTPNLNDLEKLEKICKGIIIIDDHKATFNSNKLPKSVKHLSSNDGHSATALTWKVFYPKKKIPKNIKMIDLTDSSKYMQDYPYTNFFTSAITFRITSNPRYTKAVWDSGKPFEEAWDVIENNNNAFWIIIGKYMSEVQENIKEQIAKNAQVIQFQGYKVGVLNFLDPVLTKRIGRQIWTNMHNRGINIDFVVMWGWEHANNVYRVNLNDDQKQNKINLGEMATKLGKIGGTGKRGGGHQHIGNFYWPKKKGMDIWDLFNKNYLK